MMLLVLCLNLLTFNLIFGQDVIPNNGQSIGTTAVPTPGLNIVELKPNGIEKILKLPSKPMVNLDRGWIIMTDPGSRITLECSFDIGPEINTCDKDMLIIDYGGEIKKYCKSADMTIYSKVNLAKVRIKLSNTNNKLFQCKVQAILDNSAENIMTTTPLPETVDDNEDSSEYGVTPGMKGTTCNCGRANKGRARIVNGSETLENEFPWMVLINIHFPDYTMSLCGGSIITNRHILTAAHCVFDRTTGIIPKPDNVKIMLAEHDIIKIKPYEVEVEGQKIYIHDEYLRKRSHDIAIIFTKETITFNRMIGKICLTPVKLPIAHKNVLILGWGQTVAGSSIQQTSYTLMKAKGRVYGVCNGPDWEICTSPQPSSTCFGDSGSPQAWLDPETNRYTQVSLSARVIIGCSSILNIHTDVVYFYDWIQNVIKESDPKQRTCGKIN